MSVGASLVAAAVTTSSTSSGWPERIALVLAALLMVGALGWVLWRGWRSGHPSSVEPRALPPSPDDLGEATSGPFKGRYLATTSAGDPSVVVSSLGLGGAAAANIAVTNQGVFIERDGCELLFIPAGSLTGAQLETAIGGTAFGLGPFLIIFWKHGRERWQTGFRAISVRRHAELATAIESLRAGTSAALPADAPAVAIPEVPL